MLYNDYIYINFKIKTSEQINNISNIIYKQIILVLIFLIIVIIYKENTNKINKEIYLNQNYYNNSKNFNDNKLDYNNFFVVIKDNNCKICGLMAYYKHYLVCIAEYLNLGYSPIIDLKSFPNIFNSYNISSIKKIHGKFFFINLLDIH